MGYGRVRIVELEGPFIYASVNPLEREIGQAGKFLMLKVTDKWNEIPKFASIWNT